MAWDFSTDPGFEEQLEWMRDFVRTLDLGSLHGLALAESIA